MSQYRFRCGAGRERRFAPLGCPDHPVRRDSRENYGENQPETGHDAGGTEGATKLNSVCPVRRQGGPVDSSSALYGGGRFLPNVYWSEELRNMAVKNSSPRSSCHRGNQGPIPGAGPAAPVLLSHPSCSDGSSNVSGHQQSAIRPPHPVPLHDGQHPNPQFIRELGVDWPSV